MPVFPDLPQPLQGERAWLRFAAERDIPEILIAHQDDPQLHVRLGLERAPSGAELGRRTEGEPVERDLGIGVRFTIVRPGDDVCVGQLDVHRVDWENQRAELGVWVAPAARGQGLATDALRQAGRWLLGPCRLARVELLTAPDNIQMITAARAAGFVEEGMLRAYLRERGRRLDVAVLSLLPTDLEAAA